MDITSALKRSWREDITLRSIIANTVIQYYFDKTQKKIDIESIQIRWKKVIIKTGNSLINTELLFMSGDIKTLLENKVSQMHLPLWKNFELRFTV